MRRDLLALVLVLVAVALPYLGGLQNEFVWLDHFEIVEGGVRIDTFEELLAVLRNDANTPGYQRPVYNLIHTADHVLFGLEPFGYHLSSLVLHLVNVALVFALVRRLGWGTGSSASLAGLWGLHPVNAAVAGLVHAKADLAYVGCALVAFLLLDVERRAPARRGVARVGTALVLLVGCLSKENAFLYAPVVSVLWLARWRGRGYGGHVVAAWAATAFALVPRALYSESGAFDSPNALADRVSTFATIYATELWRCVLPAWLAIADTVTFFPVRSGASQAAWAGGVLVLVGFQVWLWLRSPSTRPWIALWNVALLPVSQVVPILHFRADRFLYLPSLAVVGLAVVAARRLRGLPLLSPTVLPALGLVIALALGLRTHARVAEFADDLTLFTAETARTPGYREGEHNLARALDRLGRHEEADAHYRAAFEGRQGTVSWVNTDALIANYALNLLDREEYAAARDLLERYVDDMSPGRYRDVALSYLGIADFETGRYHEALALFQGFLGVYPEDAGAWFWAGKSAFGSAEYALGREYLDRFLALEPEGRRADEAREALDWLDAREPR